MEEEHLSQLEFVSLSGTDHKEPVLKIVSAYENKCIERKTKPARLLFESCLILKGD